MIFSQAVSFARVQALLAVASSGLTFNGQGLSKLASIGFAQGATPTISQPQAAAGVGATSTWYAQQGAAGSVGGVLKIGGGSGGVPGTQLAGDVQIDLGTAISNVSPKFSILTNGTGGNIDIQQTGVNTVRILAGSTLVLAGPGSVEIDCSGAPQAVFGNGTMTWSVSNPNPTYSQSNVATNAATGQTMTFQAQNSTGTGATVGGDLVVTSGTGVTVGSVKLQAGGTTKFQVNTTGVGFNASAPVGKQLSGGTTAGVITGLVALGLFSS